MPQGRPVRIAILDALFNGFLHIHRLSKQTGSQLSHDRESLLGLLVGAAVYATRQTCMYCVSRFPIQQISIKLPLVKTGGS